jgi:hypothetical protein
MMEGSVVEGMEATSLQSPARSMQGVQREMISHSGLPGGEKMRVIPSEVTSWPLDGMCLVERLLVSTARLAAAWKELGWPWMDS